MADELSINRLLETSTVALRDVVCSGVCRHKSAEECAQSTYFVFPYRGAYVRHLGSDDAVAEPNQVLCFNKDECFRVSLPVSGGDACLSLWVDEPLLSELVPKGYVRGAGVLAFRSQRVRIDARAQALVALLRHGLQRGVIVEPLEGETLLFLFVWCLLVVCLLFVLLVFSARQLFVFWAF